MWLPKANAAKKGTGSGSVAVAIDRDKSSQHALKWTIENLASRGQTIALIHVLPKTHSASGNGDLEEGTPQYKQQIEKQTRDLFVSFHCYCTRKEIHCLDIVLHDADRVKAIAEYVLSTAIENLVLGAPSRNGFMRRFKNDLPTSVSKSAPDFCSVYVISKGKVSLRGATRPAPFHSSLLCEIDSNNSTVAEKKSKSETQPVGSTPPRARKSVDLDAAARLPLAKRTGQGRILTDFTDSDTDISFISASHPESDISFISSGRPSVDRSSFTIDLPESGRTSRISTSSEYSIGSHRLGIKFSDLGLLNEISSVSEESERTSCSYSSQSFDDVEAEMRRLRLELKQTMDMYSTACKEALSARQQATELQRLRNQEERRLEEAKMSEESVMSIVEKERAKTKAAMEAAEAAKRLAEVEAKRRLTAEMKTLKEAEEKSDHGSFPNGIVRYRRYTVEEIEEGTKNFAESQKVGEGGYGPVFKGYLDHTPVAVKVLRPDAAQGRSQFQKEVDVLSCIRHPNMVLLLGACPEFGILVYEFMAKGSLEDRLFRRGNTPPLTWQLRFRIAAEMATGLLFLHQTKPEPIVHRDLKPGNILLDHNYVSKISDVGLARLVPAVAENVTQYRVTSAAGTFCYIDPEYQQTGMLGVKSDVYSFGIMLLQILTAKQPMGLAYYVEQAIEEGTFKNMLDPNVPDWPVEEALSLAKLSLRCAELRRKDRPDLAKEVLPELSRLRDLADESLESAFYVGRSPHTSQVSYSSENRSGHDMSFPRTSGTMSSSSMASLEAEKPSGPTEEEG
ncbi:PREDICTED: U-box domain-containing protein 35-like [Tarenaya hassleriana]|uniref:U-box domain-containing protein 35-like n=1 Tax=Tarenaya hassleriana TaxID=28532 RepID=UPI00053C692E|nr:PREDICTED: U-box domain-containing protein 35-like [Tarenaya hassleriana]